MFHVILRLLLLYPFLPLCFQLMHVFCTCRCCICSSLSLPCVVQLPLAFSISHFPFFPRVLTFAPSRLLHALGTLLKPDHVRPAAHLPPGTLRLLFSIRFSQHLFLVSNFSSHAQPRAAFVQHLLIFMHTVVLLHIPYFCTAPNSRANNVPYPCLITCGMFPTCILIFALCIRICEAFCGNDRLPIEKGLNPLNSIRQHSPPPTHTFFQQNYQHYLHQCQPSHYRWEPRVLSSFQQQLLLCQPCYPWGVVVEVVEERGVWCLCLNHCPRIFQIH